MSKIWIYTVVAAFSLMVGATVHADPYTGPGFSGVAFVTDSGEGKKHWGPVFVDRDGFRVNVKSDGQNIASLIRWDESVAYTMMVDQRMYIKVPIEEIGMDAYEARPCVNYKNARKLGTETINGRITEKWRCTVELNTAQDEPPTDTTVWYDPKLAFEIKTISDNGSEFEIREITIGRQDTTLFKIPAGFQEFDMSAMMQSRQQ